MKLAAIASLTCALIVLPWAARADILYQNIREAGGGGNCGFSTTCAASSNQPIHIAAQRFFLPVASEVTQGAFTELDFAIPPTSINWAFYDEAADGSPGALVHSGSSAVTGSNVVGGPEFGLDVSVVFFDLPFVHLTGGDHFFALSAVSPVIFNFLAQGAATTGAFESLDGGDTWTPTYGSLTSVAITLIGQTGSPGVPEPGAWAMMLLGFAGIGAMVRKRSLRPS